MPDHITKSSVRSHVLCEPKSSAADAIHHISMPTRVGGYLFAILGDLVSVIPAWRTLESGLSMVIYEIRC